MRLLMINFKDILGLNGTINFLRGQPVVFYGENLAGKTNIVNALRYCLIPKDPRKRKRTYSEEQRLTKDEMLLSPLKEGNITIYFAQGEKLYQLTYIFKRVSSGTVRQRQEMYEAKAVSFPKYDDKELRNFLSRITWKRLDVYSVIEIANKMIEVGIYPEILDTLIAPSNVRNFSKTINKEIVTIPKVISQTISTIRDNIRKYLKNLETMNNVLVLERESCGNQLESLQKHLTKITPKEADKITNIFSRDIHQNLKTFLEEVESKLEKIPEETKNIENLITELDEKIRDHVRLIQELVNELENREQVEKKVEQNLLLEESKTAIDKWSNSFQNVPNIDSVDAFISFELPRNYKTFNYKTLGNPEKVQSIFTYYLKAKDLLEQARKILEKYDTTFEKLASLINSFRKLKTAIKSPLEEPFGDRAIISYLEEEQKAQVSIPVDTLIKNPQYMKIHSTPVTHKPREKITELDNLVKAQMKLLTNAIGELASAKENRSKAQEAHQALEKLLPILQKEAEELEKRREENSKKIAELESAWNQIYGSLCRAFSFKSQKIGLSTRDNLESSLEIINKTVVNAKNALQLNLKEKLKDFPELEIKKEATEQELNQIVEALAEKIKELSDIKQRCQEIRDWINKHLEEIQNLEQKLKTITLLNILVIVLKEIFDPIYERTDLETITERLAESIEAEVKGAYRRILADESLKFEHIGKAIFRNTLNNQPITHPSGSQRASISLGIMMSLARTFNLPIILDEATDRYDSNHIVTFMEYITAIANDLTNPQISLAIYKTMDIEKNPELLSNISVATIYGVERKGPLSKVIKELNLTSEMS